MKIETVREMEYIMEPKKPVSVKELLDSRDIPQLLYSTLGTDSIIEMIIRKGPDYDYLSRYVVEKVCDSREGAVTGYDSAIAELRASMPDFYKKSMKINMKWKKSHSIDDVNWIKVKANLPKDNKGMYPFEKLFETNISYEERQLLCVVGFYIECGLQALLVSPTNTNNNHHFDDDIFRSIVAINIMINRKRFHIGILDLVGSDHIASKCLNILSDFYKIEIQCGPLALNFDEY